MHFRRFSGPKMFWKTKLAVPESPGTPVPFGWEGNDDGAIISLVRITRRSHPAPGVLRIFLDRFWFLVNSACAWSLQIAWCTIFSSLDANEAVDFHLLQMNDTTPILIHWGNDSHLLAMRHRLHRSSLITTLQSLHDRCVFITGGMSVYTSCSVDVFQKSSTYT